MFNKLSVSANKYIILHPAHYQGERRRDEREIVKEMKEVDIKYMKEMVTMGQAS